MENLYNNIEISSKLLNAIWIRKPIIISLKNDNNVHKYIDEVLSFVPDYRLLIACGKVPKRVMYAKTNIKIFDLKDKKSFAQGLFASFEEENISVPPLQLICFDADEWIFSHILNQIDRGWVAITHLDKDKIANLFQSQISFSVNHDLATFFFLNNLSENSLFEKQLILTTRDKPEAIVRLLLQKKMSEIRYVGQALIKEIEQGKKISQSEIEEIYNIDTSAFTRTIEVVKSETRMDISKYIEFTPEAISLMLGRITKLNGVLTAVCLKQNKIIGIIKNEQLNINNSYFFPSFYALLVKLERDFHLGKNIKLSFTFDNAKQLLFIKTDRISDYQDIVFAFILKSSVNIFLLLHEIDNIFKEA